mmetsp:Transcript_25521/g.44486  ORF Transcript_25521/g.44486 Transcript_25521/m.44486 type:complete len:253 (+) Transcript_25521:1464-2222(+)
MTELNWSIVTSVAKQEYLDGLKEWLQSATQQELKGLLVIKQVLKHKGTKKFKPRKICKLPKLQRTKGSIYQENYNSPVEDNFLLSHRKLKELPASHILSPTALSVLETWVELHDDRYFRNLLLTCLRGMAAVCNCYSPPVTENRATFVWKPMPPRHKVVDRKQRSISQTDFRPQEPLPEMLRTMSPKVDLKHKRPHWMKGNGNILAMPGSTKISSSYQDSFAAFYNSSPSSKLHRFTSSVALTRMIPSSIEV